MFLVWVGLHISLTSAFLRPSSPLPRKLAQGRGISPLSRPVLLQDAVADVELQPSRPQDEEEEQDPRTLEEIRAENNQTLAELRQLVDRLEQKVPVEEKAARSNVKKMYDNTGNEEDVLDTVREFQRASQDLKEALWKINFIEANYDKPDALLEADRYLPLAKVEASEQVILARFEEEKEGEWFGTRAVEDEGFAKFVTNPNGDLLIIAITLPISLAISYWQYTSGFPQYSFAPNVE
uniref:Uncharacterized protein n=1 Tax=Chromera velia CCMP2878 TaxID=1169474 RepID=A0A0G4HRV2_9ALVE|eukprot:Cvel_8191.t1-p1 / transcript=Cvel_8191.t1 / gene=Cvel_8191 / organism=Chromera_velia_CCMP2878 / gene_product=hypothetical protein / transcript_product=hypothetical protein / location=Cvel_scaffold446:62720-64566(+) / protein_length=236 / sequence_SO=supercontig / SO=protein_coding / is_pseudo=false